MDRKVLLILVFGATVSNLLALARGEGRNGEKMRSLTVLSPVYEVDRPYRSMKGPSSVQSVSSPESDNIELLWVTGFRATIVGPDGQTPRSQEFMCHSNLDFNQATHSQLFNLPRYHTNRLFTLSQGQQEIRFPRGFGLPYYSDESFRLTTQVLNFNLKNQSEHVRHKVTIEYILDGELEEPMKPLFMTSGWGMVLLEGEDGFYGVENPDEAHGEGCLPGAAAGPDKYDDEFNRKFSGHWVVKPGREMNGTLVSNIMELPYDTTVHYMAVHLHPYAESLELVDLTTEESVFKSRTRGFTDKIGLEHVQYFSSGEGIPVYKDHEYELVSTYNNTTSEDQDSMAVLLLYLQDKKFQKRERVKVAQADRPVRLSRERIRLSTHFGDLTMALYPDVAPRHVQKMLRLVRLGVYDTVGFSRVEPGFLLQTGYARFRSGEPLTPEQKEAIHALAAEFSNLEHRGGVVSMVLDANADPHSANASFFILLGEAPFLDGRYTIFWRDYRRLRHTGQNCRGAQK